MRREFLLDCGCDGPAEGQGILGLTSGGEGRAARGLREQAPGKVLVMPPHRGA